MRTAVAIALGCALFSSALFAQAELRVALVIGNDKYAHLPDLNNAGKDARDMAAKLKSLGFEVIARYNVTEREMGRAIRSFSAQLSAGGTGLAFYAGHGIQADGTNYLIPADANIEIVDDLATEAMDANDILRAMKDAGNPLNILILDACRDNPLPKRARSSARGLAITAVPSGAKGTAILYAAGPGQTAQDGAKGDNGVFTGALLNYLDQPGWSLERVFKATSREVLRRTDNRQRPWQLVSMQGDFVFKLERAALVARTPAKPVPPQATDPSLAVWRAIQNSRQASDFETFLATYPDSPMTPFAKGRLEALQKTKVAAVTPPPKPKGALVPVEAAFVTTRNANVRAEPSVNAAKVITLPTGTEVYVPNKTADGRWLKVEQDGKFIGYIFANLLHDKVAYRETERASADVTNTAKLGPKADTGRSKKSSRRIESNPLSTSARDKPYWTSIRDSKDPEDFREYLSIFPRGIYSDIAKDRLASLNKVSAPVIMRETESNPPSTSVRDRPYWTSIRDSKDPEDFREYLSIFPHGIYAGIAKARLASLKKVAAPVITRKTKPEPVFDVKIFDGKWEGKLGSECFKNWNGMNIRLRILNGDIRGTAYYIIWANTGAMGLNGHINEYKISYSGEYEPGGSWIKVEANYLFADSKLELSHEFNNCRISYHRVGN